VDSRGNGVSSVSAVINDRVLAKEGGPIVPAAPPTAISPSSGPRTAQWLDQATAEQRLALTCEQELEAWEVHARINLTEDWRTLRIIASELDGSRGGNSAESLPDWVIDAFVARISERMDVPLVGSADNWAVLSDDQRTDVWRLHSEIVRGHEFFNRTSREHRNILMISLNGADVRRLPYWARQELLVLLNERVPPETAPATPQDKTPVRSPEEADFDEFCGGGANNGPSPADGSANQVKEQSGSAAVANAKSERFCVDDRWPEGFWGLPNWLSHSALFSSFKGDAGYYGSTAEEMIELHSLRDLIISACGPRLHQGDIDFILHSIHSCRFGDTVETTPARFLHGMDRGSSTRDVDELIKSLTRLKNCHVDLSVKHRNSHRERTWRGPLIRFEVLPKPKSRSGRGPLIRISLDPEFGKFCGKDFTWIEVKDRAALRQHRMAAGLHAFYSTHVEPYDYNLETIRSLLGVKTEGKQFEVLLQSALKLLEEKRMILGWVINSGKLTVTPKLTLTKLRFLAKKGITPTIVRTLPAPGAKCTPMTAAPATGRAGWWRPGPADAVIRAFAGLITRLQFRGCAPTTNVDTAIAPTSVDVSSPP